MKFFLFLALCLTLQSAAFAQGKTEPDEAACVNDKDGKKGASSQAINSMIAKAKEPLAEAFRTYRAAMCEEAINTPAPGTLRAFLKAANLNHDVVNATASQILPTFIKKQCVEASLQRDIDQKAYACNEKKQAKELKSGDKKIIPCLNQESVDYIHYAVNLAIKCFASIRDPIDPRFLLKKINTETGFNFYLASGGGTGLNQITSSPVQDLAGKKKGEGNARSILEDLAASADPACDPFKNVLTKDLKTPPPMPPSDNVCTYVAADDGLARTLIIGMGYYIYTRDEVVMPFLKDKMGDSALVDKDLINYATLLSYGPKGPNGAKAFMDGLNKKTGIAKAIQKIKTAPYVKSADKRYSGELLPFLKPGTTEFTDKEKRGDTCVGR